MARGGKCQHKKVKEMLEVIYPCFFCVFLATTLERKLLQYKSFSSWTLLTQKTAENVNKTVEIMFFTKQL
jgi:hypothetical protein